MGKAPKHDFRCYHHNIRLCQKNFRVAKLPYSFRGIAENQFPGTMLNSSTDHRAGLAVLLGRRPQDVVGVPPPGGQ